MYHTIIIVGNVGKDPEMRYTPSGQAVTSFSVATNRQYTTGNGEQVKETIWFRISTWGKTAEVCNQYIKKGSKVLVEGRLTPDKVTGGPRIWTKQDGSAGASFEITASTVRFLSSRGDGGEGGGSPVAGSGTDMVAELPPEDDIPFERKTRVRLLVVPSDLVPSSERENVIPENVLLPVMLMESLVRGPGNDVLFRNDSGAPLVIINPPPAVIPSVNVVNEVPTDFCPTLSPERINTPHVR